MAADFAALKLTVMDQAKEIKELSNKLSSLASQEQRSEAANPNSPNNSSGPVVTAFYAERNTNFLAEMTYINYTSAQINYNNCFNQTSGFFTAPEKGVYTFFFSGVKMKAQEHSAQYLFRFAVGSHAKLTISMRKVNAQNTTDYDVITTGHINSYDRYGWFPLTIQTIVSLEAEDQVGVFLEEGFLFGQHEGEDPKPVGSGLIMFSGYFLRY